MLEYPFVKDNIGDSLYYRRPRGFLGAFEYDKTPCFPHLNFTQWPCPYVPQTRMPTAKPTGKPTAPPIAFAASNSPTRPKTSSGQSARTDAPVTPHGVAMESDTTRNKRENNGVGRWASWNVVVNCCIFVAICLFPCC